jgi:hypothetical protein
MKLNNIATGIELVGTNIKSLQVQNNIVDIEKEAKRSFGLNINEPKIEETDDVLFSQMMIEIEVEIEQSNNQTCKIKLSMEGAFLSEKGVDKDNFKQLVAVNGAAALIGIARGKIETVSAAVFNNGKVVIPFVNVVDYYKSLI